MSSLWLVPTLETDFDTDIEDLIIQYVYDNWTPTETGLEKPSEPVAQDSKIAFRPGFFDFSRPYEVTALQTVTRAQKQTTSHYIFITEISLNLRAKRLTTDEDPTRPLELLEIMEQEIQRITFIYRLYDIPGIDQLIYDGYERIYDPADTYAKNEWASATRIKVMYQKQKFSA